jgi:MFS family permease
MQNAAAGWLMTSLRPDPFEVALVQAATTLPMFVFSLPAGALADIIDRRRLLIMVQIAAVAIAALFAIFVWLNWVTPNWLLTFMSLSGIATVLALPPWQSIVPQLVPKEELRSAVALNGVGLNISRAIGPALAGLAIGALGMAAPYWINALSTFAVIAALIWWRPPQPIAQSLPAERFVNAIRSGLRYARYNPDLRGDLDPVGRLLPARKRLLGAFAASGPRTDGRRPGDIRHTPRGNRRRRCLRRIRIAGSGKAGRRSGHDGGDGRDGTCARPVRHRS